jgi:hypothetical protein
MGRRILVVADTFLPYILGGGEKFYWVSRDALPLDARIVNVMMRFIGQDHQDVCFLVESAEWEDSEEGKPYLEFSPVISTIPTHSYA